MKNEDTLVGYIRFYKPQNLPSYKKHRAAPLIKNLISICPDD